MIQVLLALPFLIWGAVDAHACGDDVIRCSGVSGRDKREFSVRQPVERLAAYLGDSKKYVVIDTRPPVKFASCRLRGALNYEFPPAGQPASGTSEALLSKSVLQRAIAKGKKVVLICSTCHRSSNAAAYALCQWGVSPRDLIWIAEGVDDLKRMKSALLTGDGC